MIKSPDVIDRKLIMAVVVKVAVVINHDYTTNKNS